MSIFESLKRKFIELILVSKYSIDSLDFWSISRIYSMNRKGQLFYQLDRLKKILFYATSRVPYWRRVLHTVGINPENITWVDFQKLPISDKQDLRELAGELFSADYKNFEFVEVTTSGSTGIPTKIVVDKECLKKRILVHRYHLIPLGSKNVKDYGHFWTLETMKNLGLQIILSKFKDNLDGLYRFLKERGIKSLGGPVSRFIFIAEDLNRRQINLDLRCVQTGSEYLSENTRKYLEATFKCPIYDKYNSAEFGHLGFECQTRGGFHVNIINVHVEIIDDDGKPAEIGKIGRIVVTSFDNKIAPFIRYALGDTGKWLEEKRCVCGLKTPRFAFEGRALHYLRLPDGRSYSVTALVRFLDKNYSSLIKKIQIIQETADIIIIKIVPTDIYKGQHDLLLLNSVLDLLRCLEPIKLEIKKVNSIENLPSGKAQIFISKL